MTLSSFFFSSRRRHTRSTRDWSSDVCSSDLDNTKQDGVLILLKGYNRQNFRVNVDQALTPRLDLSLGGFFGKSNNNQVAEGPGAPFFGVTFVAPDINMLAPNADGTPYNEESPWPRPGNNTAP